MNLKSLYIKTFGCQMNQRDSEIIAQLLAPLGYVVDPCMDQADMIILNTCSIREKAEQKVYSFLGQLNPRTSTRANSRRPLIVVAGCVAQQEGDKIFQRMPHVDIVVGTQQLYDLTDMVGRILDNRENRYLATNLSSSFSLPSFRQLDTSRNFSEKNRGEAASPLPSPSLGFKKFVTIMQGCNNYCSYCVVPYTRGRETSRKVNDIVDEVRTLVARGVREITLLGQNVNSYGRTNPVADRSTSFADLLCRVAEVEGLQRLRFTTSNPHDLSDDLIDCFREINKLCSHFHLPVQAGSDAVLARMRRRYTISDYLEKVKKLRAARPDIAISTDIIVGFPGESESDFEKTMQLLETVRFHSAFSFKYSDRPGTLSATFDDKVDESIKSARLARYQQRQDEITFQWNKKYVGKKVELLVEKINEDGSGSGRTGTNHIVHLQGLDGCIRPGDFLIALISRAGRHSLGGSPCSQSATT